MDTKKLEVEKLGDDKYRIRIITTETVNKKQLQSIFKENRKIVEDCKKGITDVNDFLQGNENIEGEVCGDSESKP